MISYEQLRKDAAYIRLLTLEGLHCAQSGHTGGSLSIADMLAVLYRKQMNVDPKNPHNPERDRFVLSKGHAAPSLYATLAYCGFFPKEDLKQLRRLAGHLQGHPSLRKTPGVDMSTGSLGQGLSAANGMAMSLKYDKNPAHVYCIVGDGEIQEGQIWEAAMSAAHYKLDNLTLFADLNGLQIDGNVTDVMNDYPVKEKFEAFGWNVIEIDGHDVEAIDKAIEEAKTVKGKPTAIMAKTIKGKGVSFMEGQASWHGTAPNDEQYAQAVKELEELI